MKLDENKIRKFIGVSRLLLIKAKADLRANVSPKTTNGAGILFAEMQIKFLRKENNNKM